MNFISRWNLGCYVWQNMFLLTSDNFGWLRLFPVVIYCHLDCHILDNFPSILVWSKYLFVLVSTQRNIYSSSKVAAFSVIQNSSYLLWGSKYLDQDTNIVSEGIHRSFGWIFPLVIPGSLFEQARPITQGTSWCWNILLMGSTMCQVT